MRKKANDNDQSVD